MGHSPPIRKNAAFTLIELMVVVVLVGVLTAMIIPEMKGTYEDALLRSTGREIMSVLNLACSRAVALNQKCRVRLDMRSGKYQIEIPPSKSGSARSTASSRDVPGGTGTLDSRISIEVRRPAEEPANPDNTSPEMNQPLPEDVSEPGQTGEVINFYPDGTADDREILLRDRLGFQLALRLNPVTARVRVIDLGRNTSAPESEEAPK